MSLLNAMQKRLNEVITPLVPFYDGPPSDAVYPYCELEGLDFVPDDAECIDGRSVTFLLKVWGDDQNKQHPTSALVDQLYTALHDVKHDLDDPYTGHSFVPLARVHRAQDAVRSEGTVNIRFNGEIVE